MNRVLDFIYHFEGNQREIMLYFHNILTTDFNLQDKFRYKIPFYFGKSWICYMNPTDKDKVEFAFPRGNELSNVQGLLESRGRKQVYSILFNCIEDIPKIFIDEVIQEAILLDEVKPYQSMRKK